MAKSDRVDPHSPIAIANSMGYFPPPRDRLDIGQQIHELAVARGYYKTRKGKPPGGFIQEHHWQECCRDAIELMYGKM
jgi:hypothetical protein